MTQEQTERLEQAISDKLTAELTLQAIAMWNTAGATLEDMKAAERQRFDAHLKLARAKAEMDALHKQLAALAE